MGTPADNSNFEFLIEEIKQLRKGKADLLRQLSEAQKKSSQPPNGESSKGDSSKSQSSTGQSSTEQFPLGELSRITDGIVHDMRNGLGIIRNTIGFLSDDLKETPYPHYKDTLKISRSLDFCEVVLRNLSALGGQDILRPEQVNLETIVREICFMLENKLVDIELVIETEKKRPTILADAGHMKQVFMNLIKNAGEAMPDGGILTYRFFRIGDMLHVEVQDTGQGISEENQKKLFRELFTTKDRGYGIGLFVVRTIVERHGGKINVQSKVGEGTTFILLLPITGGLK